MAMPIIGDICVTIPIIGVNGVAMLNIFELLVPIIGVIGVAIPII